MALNHPTRRSFVAGVTAVAAGLFPHDLLAQARPQARLPVRTIPSTGETLPVIGLGSSKSVLEIPANGVDPIRQVLRILLRMGGRVVDSSVRTEDIDARFGGLLAEPVFSESLFLATKINTPDRDTGIQQMRQTQRLFGRPALDLVQVESLRGLEEHWPNLREWKDNGQTRYIGATVSTYDGFDRMEEFMRRARPDFVHVNYSVAEPRAEDRLLPLAEDLGIAVLTNRPFMNGNYFQMVQGTPLPPWAAEFDCTSWAQFSVKYIVAHPAVTCALTETTNPVHMEENVGAALRRLPGEPARRRMREILRGL